MPSNWEVTVVVMTLLSIAIFALQRTLGLLDPIFEICIFHIPTLLSILLYLREMVSSA